MLNALKIFNSSIDNARTLSNLYSFLCQTVIGPYTFDDLLRSQIVYSVSAFDKLLHDIIRVGMVSCYAGNRPSTDKYHSEPISIQLHLNLALATIPPAEIIFEQEIVRKLSRYSYQDPQKVAEGLSLIWNEKHKWAKIAAEMDCNEQDAKTKLKLITDRRNAIVHESDIQPVTNLKTPITLKECNDVTDFLKLCGESITKLVHEQAT